MTLLNPDANANLLVVDDAPANLQLLGDMLRQHDFRVRLVPSGALALQAVRHEPPDLILLDINMPGMSGFEVCERLKADAALKAIPVIFLSALDGTLDKVKAFGLGGVDYVTKPFQAEEVEARVRTHLALHRQERELQARLVQLKELERLRDSLVHMIVHDMRAPLSAMRMSLSMLQAGPIEDPETASLVLAFDRAAETLNEMATQLLDVSRLEAGQMPIHKLESDLDVTLRAALASLAVLAGRRRLQFEAPPSIRAVYDQNLLRRVVVNLLTNALKFTPPAGEVKLSVTRDLDEFRISVSDTGSGIAPEFHQRIFEKFGQVGLPETRVGTGLGLTFCKLAVEAHGGRIGVESSPGHGSTFWFTLPAQSPA